MAVGEVRTEIDRRREHIEADKKGFAQLEWAVEIAGKLGAEDNDRIGDFVAFE